MADFVKLVLEAESDEVVAKTPKSVPVRTNRRVADSGRVAPKRPVARKPVVVRKSVSPKPKIEDSVDPSFVDIILRDVRDRSVMTGNSVEKSFIYDISNVEYVVYLGYFLSGLTPSVRMLAKDSMGAEVLNNTYSSDVRVEALLADLNMLGQPVALAPVVAVEEEIVLDPIAPEYEEVLEEDFMESPVMDASGKYYVFPAGSQDVSDGKDHFPVNTVKEARAALSYVNQYSRTPPWFTGSGGVQTMVDRVVSAVKSRFPSVDISEDAKIAKPYQVEDSNSVPSKVRNILSRHHWLNTFHDLDYFENELGIQSQDPEFVSWLSGLPVIERGTLPATVLPTGVEGADYFIVQLTSPGSDNRRFLISTGPGKDQPFAAIELHTKVEDSKRVRKSTRVVKDDTDYTFSIEDRADEFKHATEEEIAERLGVESVKKTGRDDYDVTIILPGDFIGNAAVAQKTLDMLRDWTTIDVSDWVIEELQDIVAAQVRDASYAFGSEPVASVEDDSEDVRYGMNGESSDVEIQEEIERLTDFDVLGSSDDTLLVINRNESDGIMYDIPASGKTLLELIHFLENENLRPYATL